MFANKRLSLFLASSFFTSIFFTANAHAQTSQVFCVRNTGGVVNFRSRSACLRGERQLSGFGQVGPVGPQGPVGATGPAGAQGLTGPVGPAGAPGEPAPDSFSADAMAPDDSINVDADGDVGIGTTTPSAKLTVEAGQLTGTNTFGYPDIAFPQPAFTIQGPDGTFLQPASGIHNLLHLHVHPWFRGQDTGIAIVFGGLNNPSRIIHYADIGNSFGTRLALQTNNAFAAMTPNPGIKIYENNVVTVGIAGDPTDPPGSSGDLIVGGYTKLATVVGAPPAVDCDEVSERGRMKVDSAAGLLWICTDASWISK